MESNLSRFRDWAKSLVHTILGVPQRTEITIETDQLLVIRRRRCIRAWCQQCGYEVDMITLTELEGMSGITQPMLFDPKAQGWHWAQAEDGSPLVCLESLLKPNSGFSPRNEL